MDDQELEPDEYDPLLNELRGERDVALFFDVRWIHGNGPKNYIEGVLAEAGTAIQTSWAGYGKWEGQGYEYEALWRLFVTTAAIARPFDFPEPHQPLAVVLLEAVRRTDYESRLPYLMRAPAFVGHTDITFPSEMRTAVMRVIQWR